MYLDMYMYVTRSGWSVGACIAAYITYLGTYKRHSRAYIKYV